MKSAVTDSASAAELETPDNLAEALHTGFLPDDPHYRLTGEFKDKDKEKPPETVDAPAAPTEEPSATPGDKGDDKTAAAPEAAETQRRGKTAETSESRWAKLSRENREMREENARLKALAEERSATRDSQQTSQPAAEAKPQTKGRPEPKIDELDPKTGKAKYTTWEDYQRDLRKWDREQALLEFQETSSRTQREQELQRAEQTLAQGFARKLEPVRAKHADFDEVALNPDLLIPKGSVADGFLLDSDHAGEVLYYLGQHPEILQGFYGDWDAKTGKYVNRITPFAQARALTRIELELSGAFGTSSSSSVRPITQAPRPPNQVSGKGTVAKDAAEQAVEDGDTETYMRTQNAKELARLKRK